jgi:uncharacterized membrane protein
MTRAQFLDQLKSGLKGLPQAQIDDIVADYQAHFSDASAAGRSEAEVAASLGDPLRLAKELRAEVSIKRWEEDATPKNFFNAGAALFGLLALDVLILLPLAFVMFIVLGSICFALFIVGTVGLALTAALFHGGTDGVAVALAGLGLVCGAIGAGAVILLLLGGAMRMLAHYGRLHYRLLEKPAP